MDSSTIKLSQNLQEIARLLDAAITEAAGIRVPFTLIVYTPDRANYINTADRQDSINAIKGLLEFWEAGMPDVPAHKIS